jgi:choline dehydrogenase
MSAMEFDYVIVGAGAGGCALAGRFSEDPGVSICLLRSADRAAVFVAGA